MKRHEVAGQTFGRLTVLGPGEPYLDPRGNEQLRWLCRCECGVEKSIAGSSLIRGKARSCGCARQAGLRKAGVLRRRVWVSYFGMHRRLGRDRGKASDQLCVDCGRQAKSWSYDGTDPNELTYDPPGKRTLRYSLDQGRYHPRCTGCHNLHDGIAPPVRTRFTR